MEITIKTFVLMGSVILTGLSAGLFYAWSVSVIPGTLNLSDTSYLETMQSINRAILNPVFYFIFFGSFIFLGLGSIFQYAAYKPTFWLILSAALIYLTGTIGVTALGNVPLNNQLDVMNLNAMGKDKLASFRTFYESGWNQLHLYRTVFAIISFILSAIALGLSTKY
ncbi:MAG: DUF1772 domain-containing protein [Reichenbachiella sp.]|uniref:anthrone oxygenase family protein n=1 Tax=Reichenbachiella sp. TaxID=2184521 RepID=UPI003264678A